MEIDLAQDRNDRNMVERDRHASLLWTCGLLQEFAKILQGLWDCWSFYCSIQEGANKRRVCTKIKMGGEEVRAASSRGQFKFSLVSG